MEKFRLLKAGEIDCRVAMVKSNGVSVLLYKDARCDMNILDESVGAENWQRSHSRDNANCTVSIWDSEKKMWVSKEDTGTESNTEKEKGLASDSFKRACFNWGIGRELYTAPFIWISDKHCNIQQVKNSDKYTCRDSFYVSAIGYDDNRCIDRLQIKNTKTGNVVYELGKSSRETFDTGTGTDRSVLADEAKKATIREICKKHNIDVDMLYSSNGITEGTCTENQAARILISFKRKYGDES